MRRRDFGPPFSCEFPFVDRSGTIVRSAAPSLLKHFQPKRVRFGVGQCGKNKH
jgi:hypothetical protein